ncbi:MAG: DUF433 domain-containing protein [Bryobacteraceae bacterium]|nr:DUF433 domain-containing protein [Bryobacteraceae bacterium]
MEASMPEVQISLLERITTNADVRFGKPCIRGHRITIQEILERLSSGAATEDETSRERRCKMAPLRASH